MPSAALLRWLLCHSREETQQPASLPVAGYVSGLTHVLNFGDVPPRVGLTAIEIGETIDLRQLSAGQRLPVPARNVGILRERRDRPTDERWTLGDREMGRPRGGVTPVRFGDAIRVEHGFGSQPTRSE